MPLRNLVAAVLSGLILSSCSSVPPAREEPPVPVKLPPARTLQSQLDALLGDTLLAPCLIGVEIRSLENGKTLYRHNTGNLFHPASNMKLLTTAVALRLLGPGYKFRTSVLSPSPIHNGILAGDLVIRGSGDPLLRSSDLDSLASLVRECGIDSITGNLVGDVSYFDTLSWGAGWMWDDEPDADEAFFTPLTVNSNAIEVLVRPGRRSGEPAGFTLEPPTATLRVRNSSITSPDTLIPPLQVTRRRGDNTILVEGRIEPHSAEAHFDLSVWKPEFHFLELFREKLSEHGVSLRGPVRIDIGAGGVQLAEFSHPIDSVLHQINKLSDNLGAENLLKTMAAEESHEAGSSAHGLSIMKSALATMGIDTAKMILADGSGVSWYNAISPAAIVQLLKSVYEDRDRFERYYESLPVGGVDGTLKNRMKGTPASGNVHAKTGSLTGASSLSGYVTSADGKLLAFSILCNHFPGRISILREVQDKIVELLAGSRAGAE
ncbi:MAG TPA: D-alanyl-D-alanine carboxypeptidase/D-alanyl-D-alanine-endopeptidase [Bacteroidota bacterium]|jgi:D-alanyl-D-alanine carboxypeptidase/D-alanyl-D-alanine-endopeptidase (penicillin-binding protein 4)